MKLNLKTLLALGLALVDLHSMDVRAAETAKTQPVDQVTIQKGTLLATAQGKTFTPTNTVGMPFDISVMTNMTFKVKDGPARQLTEGQVLRKDGMLQSPDGSIVPVMDHVAMLKGTPVLVKNGNSVPIRTETELGNGTKVFPDGTIYFRNGNSTKLLDGQLYKLTGGAIPATDTVTLKGGKVVVQKDGSMIKLPPGRTIMMNNGTKVFGDGKLIYFDGSTKQLGEGETVDLEGVRRDRL